MGNLALNGSSSGQITISPPAVAGSNTATLPAGTGTIIETVTNMAANPVTGTPSSSNYLRGDGTWASVSASGQLIRAPQILTSGTSYTTPANCTAIYVEAVGGGGAGGGPTANTARGGGGGGGAYCSIYVSVTASTAYTYAIGSGGTGVSGLTGNSGGSTTMTIGATTYTASGGAGGQGGNASGQGYGGAGGAATNGQLNLAGIYGNSWVTNNGAGGGGGSPSGTFVSGLGGIPIITGGAGTGGAGTGYGCGGAGGASTGGNQTGGAGYQGVIRIWEYT